MLIPFLDEFFYRIEKKEEEGEEDMPLISPASFDYAV
jgi:hypothetical protein